jgi:hypothetical protein
MHFIDSFVYIFKAWSLDVTGLSEGSIGVTGLSERSLGITGLSEGS